MLHSIMQQEIHRNIYVVILPEELNLRSKMLLDLNSGGQGKRGLIIPHNKIFELKTEEGLFNKTKSLNKIYVKHKTLKY